MLVLRTSNLQGLTIRLIVPGHKRSIFFIAHHYITKYRNNPKSLGEVEKAENHLPIYQVLSPQQFLFSQTSSRV